LSDPSGEDEATVGALVGSAVFDVAVGAVEGEVVAGAIVEDGSTITSVDGTDVGEEELGARVVGLSDGFCVVGLAVAASVGS